MRTKPASLRPAPRDFPVIVAAHRPLRYFPGALLDNAHCIAVHGYGLASMAKVGGMHPTEIARNLRKLPKGAPMSTEQAEAIIEQATGKAHTPAAPIHASPLEEMIQRPLWR
tara:strand:- start:367 stop:702 length:336 start_codon:yes stop_codon:yes gene_type:complete